MVHRPHQPARGVLWDEELRHPVPGVGEKRKGEKKIKKRHPVLSQLQVHLLQCASSRHSSLFLKRRQSHSQPETEMGLGAGTHYPPGWHYLSV